LALEEWNPKIRGRKLEIKVENAIKVNTTKFWSKKDTEKLIFIEFKR